MCPWLVLVRNHMFLLNMLYFSDVWEIIVYRKVFLWGLKCSGYAFELIWAPDIAICMTCVNFLVRSHLWGLMQTFAARGPENSLIIKNSVLFLVKMSVNRLLVVIWGVYLISTVDFVLFIATYVGQEDHCAWTLTWGQTCQLYISITRLLYVFLT